MAVFSDRIIGTIGGGHLEFKAIARARESLLSEAGRYAACADACRTGARAWASAAAGSFTCGSRPSRPQIFPPCVNGWPPAAARWPFSVAVMWARRWYACSAACLFRSTGSTAVMKFSLTICPPTCVASIPTPVHAAVDSLAPGSLVLIMSFSHAEDLDVVAACLKRQRERGDLPYIGLIGSKSKWATFRHRLEARGFHGRRTGARHLPDRRARHHRQGARGDCRGGRGTVIANRFSGLAPRANQGTALE